MFSIKHEARELVSVFFSVAQRAGAACAATGIIFFLTRRHQQFNRKCSQESAVLVDYFFIFFQHRQ